MRIEPLGELITDEDDPSCLFSDEVLVPWLSDARLVFTFADLEGDEMPEDYAAAVRRFFALTSRDRDTAAPYLFRHYQSFCDVLSDKDIGVTIEGPGDVWQHVDPCEIHVSRRSEDGKVYISIDAECAWEPEHGLQLVYRDGGTLSRVSEQDGHLTHADAYALPESEDRI